MEPAEQADSDSTKPPLETMDFATIQKPDLAEGSEEQVLLFWGRFWGAREDLAVAFCVDMNLDSGELRHSEFIVFEDEEKLREFDPDQHFGRFRRLCRQASSNPSIPNATIEQVEGGFRKFLDNKDKIRRCRKALQSKDRQGFSDLTYDLLANLIHKGDITYQVRGELTTESGLQGGTSGGSSGGGSGSGPNSSREGEGDSDEEGTADEEDHLEVTMVTSPMQGKFPRDLQVGEEILVRATGDVVQQLPDDLRDPDKEEASRPLEARVTSLTSRPELPEGFDGSPEDYWEITVDVLNGNPARSLVHKDSQIKPLKTEEQHSSDSPAAPIYLITAGLVLIAFIVLAYLIFGL